ncbi:PEP-CTERM system TPR-repeat protein PrsT [Alteromonas ponticola]|uniref:PEP-CTERM system TPR-repeat protein PrsT n=1 Tax=Alteromonas aquimaris TaxID=2998417 RepID=A0ABT3P3U6_9ALTE|nr:XrtA/PEP-CTERM system TPR-repeat protein PrsT [Alteromonas aquimaris]MCW8107428.1 PEP-CTERM system TPR-repeat protein PrsT [Alteromonas aquimaris]
MKKALSVLFFTTALLISNVKATMADSYDKALLAFNEGEVQEAYILLKNVLQEDPAHLPSKLLMGRILLIDGHVRDAIVEFEEVLEAGADENLVLGPLARAYLFSGSYDKIYKLLRKRDLQRDTKLAIVLVAGTAYLRENAREKAIALYEKHLSMFDSSVALLTSLATLYLDENRLSEAEQLLTQAKQIRARDPDMLLVLAKLNEKRDEYDKGMELYRHAYTIAPDNPSVMRALASALVQRGKYSEATELVKKIEQETPGDIQNKLLKARILALTENHLEADKILTELSEQLSLLTDQQLNEKLELSLIAGVVAYINGNYDLASTSLSRYLSGRDATPELLGMLIDSLLRVGYVKDARKILEKHENLVVQNIQVASLACEFYLTIHRRFKCEQLMPAIVANFPDAPEITLLRAKILLNKGEREQALKVLNTTLANSETEEVLQLKTVLLSQQEAFDDALTYAKKLAEIEPNNTSYQVLFAEVLMRLGKFDQASNIIKNVLSQEPDMLGAVIAKARIAFANDDIEKANASIKKALELDKKNISVLLLAGQLHMIQNRPEQAIEHLVSAKSISKNDVRPRELLVSIYLQQKDYRSALGEINQLLGIDRLSAPYVLRKAEILIELDRKVDARKQLDIVYAHWQAQPQKLIQLSKLQILAGDKEAAEKSLISAVEYAQESIIPHLELARFFIHQGELEKAEIQVAKVVDVFGDTSNSLLIQGELNQEKERYPEAFSFYKAAHKADPQFTLAVIRMYELAQQGHLRDEMTTYLNSFIKTQPGNHFAKHLLADMYYIDRDFGQAAPLYESLVNEEGLANRHFVLNNLANIYATSDLEKAHSYIDRALSITPDSASLIDTKGWLLALSGEYKAALDKLRQSYTLNASSPSLHYHLAYTLAKLGRIEEALAVFEENKTFDKNFPEKDQAIALKNSLL